MRKLKVAFFKGYVLFLMIGVLFLVVLHKLRVYLEAEVFHGEMPQEYKLIALVIICVLTVLLAIPTIIKPVKAIRLEKDRRVTQWVITGVRPEDQKMDEEKSQKSKLGSDQR